MFGYLIRCVKKNNAGQFACENSDICWLDESKADKQLMDWVKETKSIMKKSVPFPKQVHSKVNKQVGYAKVKYEADDILESWQEVEFFVDRIEVV